MFTRPKGGTKKCSRVQTKCMFIVTKVFHAFKINYQGFKKFKRKEITILARKEKK
jgi:hypothetical protein